jgi:hypothetical protein
MMKQKILMAKNSTEDKVLKKCIENVRLAGPHFAAVLKLTAGQSNSGNYNSIEWTTPTNNIRIWPPENTALLVVNIHVQGGAINIYETPRDKFIGGVGEKESENLVLVSWKNNWWYYSIGSLRVGYIARKS